uniref:P.furiosus aor, cmo and ado-hcy genes n=1 Tax=Pyrococcus furiosus TaxID=2261 RepID=Q51740_9EURY|nr:unnamed protein product [Pyrococcus furiosus DSM 3638]
MQVKLFATLIEFTGKRKLEIHGPKTVRELLDKLEEMFPGFKKELEQGYIDFSQWKEHRASSGPRHSTFR